MVLDFSQEAFGHMNWRKEWKHIWESLSLCPTVHICDCAHSYALSPAAKPLLETERADQAMHSQTKVESFKFSKTQNNRSFKLKTTASIAMGHSYLLWGHQTHNLRCTDKGLWPHQKDRTTAPPARTIQTGLRGIPSVFEHYSVL